MARKVALNPEQVWMVQQDVKRQSLKEYAADFNVSYLTVYNARKCRGAYANMNFTIAFDDQMSRKYLPEV